MTDPNVDVALEIYTMDRRFKFCRGKLCRPLSARIEFVNLSAQDHLYISQPPNEPLTVTRRESPPFDSIPVNEIVSDIFVFRASKTEERYAGNEFTVTLTSDCESHDETLDFQNSIIDKEMLFSLRDDDKYDNGLAVSVGKRLQKYDLVQPGIMKVRFINMTDELVKVKATLSSEVVKTFEICPDNGQNNLFELAPVSALFSFVNMPENDHGRPRPANGFGQSGGTDQADIILL